ncbi:EAL domain-containing protein [Caballeronia sp. SEWSISQ10-4 2]|uniref:EAL domain-containing protein n=1 Tax=Caballeronia sp. SEWSISQ10-4 2 TaxID=2937438 RepID=UPI00264B1F9E|nr:EAL domain-containing protein [Caballeronia sp. SEWSISQ10-4 2]MDN7184424.1 EAL domain-containing protein [Caballeronia sp. SEWSISQ10-4 2]
MRRALGKASPQAAFDGIVLCSLFQPIYSLPHQRQVGYEALLRGVPSAGALLAPFELFAKAIVESSTSTLDRLSHVTHLHNAAKWLPGQTWLFLNVTPASFIDPGYAQQLADAARGSGIRPEEIVIELLESGGSDVCAFAQATQAFRSHGFLVAVDDFGAGHSNLDRLLTLRPDIVKLDRSLIHAHQPDLRESVMPKLVSLLHEAGMLVVAEGIETEEDLLLAARSGVDFVQGFLFGQPSPGYSPEDEATRQIEAVFDTLAHTRKTSQLAIDLLLMPYRTLFAEAAERMWAGALPERACEDLRALPCTVSCFFLDQGGRECIPMIKGAGAVAVASHLAPLSKLPIGRWDNRPYFVDALAQPQRLMVSAPYLSATGAGLCVTLSIFINYRGEPLVFGADLNWERLAAPAVGLLPPSA